jgi:hypothetical protein
VYAQLELRNGASLTESADTGIISLAPYDTFVQEFAMYVAAMHYSVAPLS